MSELFASKACTVTEREREREREIEIDRERERKRERYFVLKELALTARERERKRERASRTWTPNLTKPGQYLQTKTWTIFASKAWTLAL